MGVDHARREEVVAEPVHRATPGRGPGHRPPPDLGDAVVQDEDIRDGCHAGIAAQVEHVHPTEDDGAHRMIPCTADAPGWA